MRRTAALVCLAMLAALASGRGAAQTLEESERYTTVSYSSNLDSYNAYKPMFPFLGAWTDGREQLEVRWRRYSPFQTLEIKWTGPWGGDQLAVNRRQDGSFYASAAPVTTSFQPYQFAKNSFEMGRDTLTVTFANERRLRLVLAGGKLVKYLEVSAPPVPEAKPVPASAGAGGPWYIARTGIFSRGGDTGVFDRANPKRDDVRKLSMWPTGETSDDHAYKLGGTIRFGTTAKGAPLPSFAFSRDDKQVTLTAFDAKHHIQWIARYRRDKGARLLPMIDIAVAPYATLAQVKGPLEILPSGGVRVMTKAGSYAFGIRSDGEAFAHTLKYQAGKGWIDGPRIRYAPFESSNLGWLKRSETLIANGWRIYEEDQQIARENERIRRRNRERNNAAIAAALAQGMAAVNNGGGGRSTTFEPSNPGQWGGSAISTPFPTRSIMNTPEEQARADELERFKMREQMARGGAPTTFAEDAHARADRERARRERENPRPAASTASGGDDAAEAERRAEEARRAEERRKAEEAARAEKARKEKLAADEARRKREAEERIANAPVEWKEGVVLCEPAKAPSRNATCHGPLQTTYGTLGEQSGATAVAQACGGNTPVRELGQAGGYIAYGCGWGTHPDKPGSDVPARLGVGYVPGRQTFRCSRKQTTVCTSY